MSTLPSSVTDATSRPARSFPTYFASRIAIALLVTGLDALVILKSALAGVRNSMGMPIRHWTLIIAVFVITFSLAKVWYRTLRYRQPSEPNRRNPLL